MLTSVATDKQGSRGLVVLLIALAPIVLVSFAIGDDDAHGPVRRLTHSDANDEDGAFAVADDGTIYFAWISDRAGNTDVWMRSSKDGINWSDSRPVVETSVDDLMNSMVRTSDGRFHLTGRRGPWHTGQFAVWDSSSADLVNWSPPVRWTEFRAAGTFQESPNGDYWLVFLSRRSGNYDLYSQRSSDRGQSPPIGDRSCHAARGTANQGRTYGPHRSAPTAAVSTKPNGWPFWNSAQCVAGARQKRLGDSSSRMTPSERGFGEPTMIRWYNEHRPHETLGGKTPNEVFFSREAANQKSRLEPRERWPRGSPCARPQVAVYGDPGDPIVLEIDCLDGRRHFPIIHARRAGGLPNQLQSVPTWQESVSFRLR